MKKIFIILFLFVLICESTFASTYNRYGHNYHKRTGIDALSDAIDRAAQIKHSRMTNDYKDSTGSNRSVSERVKRQRKMQEVGYKILNSNNIKQRMSFSYSRKYSTPDAYSNQSYRNIVINQAMYDFIEYDDELAFVLGHEISHSVDSYRGVFKGFFYRPIGKFFKRRIESRSDLNAVDYLVKAGYNPVAGIIILNKIDCEPRYDWYLDHPKASKRLALIYLYILENYPQYLKNNALVKNPIYENFLINCNDEINNIKARYDNYIQNNPEALTTEDKDKKLYLYKI